MEIIFKNRINELKLFSYSDLIIKKRQKLFKKTESLIKNVIQNNMLSLQLVLFLLNMKYYFKLINCYLKNVFNHVCNINIIQFVE